MHLTPVVANTSFMIFIIEKPDVYIRYMNSSFPESGLFSSNMTTLWSDVIVC